MVLMMEGPRMEVTQSLLDTPSNTRSDSRGTIPSSVRRTLDGLWDIRSVCTLPCSSELLPSSSRASVSPLSPRSLTYILTSELQPSSPTPVSSGKLSRPSASTASTPPRPPSVRSAAKTPMPSLWVSTT